MSDIEDDDDLVMCLECGNEQPDMGVHVRCESCGSGPMPTRMPEKTNAEKREEGDSNGE